MPQGFMSPGVSRGTPASRRRSVNQGVPLRRSTGLFRPRHASTTAARPPAEVLPRAGMTRVSTPRACGQDRSPELILGRFYRSFAFTIGLKADVICSIVGSLRENATSNPSGVFIVRIRCLDLAAVSRRQSLSGKTARKESSACCVCNALVRRRGSVIRSC